jgi:hypothetical protein
MHPLAAVPAQESFYAEEDAMMRYTVDVVWDDAATLRDLLHQIGEEGGRVVSVLWLPKRLVEADGSPREERAGYTVISEFPRQDASAGRS